MDQNGSFDNKTIVGRIDKVIFLDSKSGRTIFTVTREDGKNCRVVGNINGIEKDSAISAHGIWKKDEKYGWQFIADSIEQIPQVGEIQGFVDDGLIHALDYSNVLNNTFKEFRNICLGYEYDEEEESDEECKDYVKYFKELLGADSTEEQKPKAEKATEPKRNTISVDGALYNSDMTKLISGPKDVASFTVPDTVTCIGGGSFAKSQIESIDIPNSVTTIGNGAFSDCCGLKDVVIPSSVEHIGDMVFTGCENLISIHVEEGNMTFRDIEGVLYSYDLSLLIYVPNGLSSITISEQATIIKYGAFHGCRRITNLIIPSTIEDISEREFKSCSLLSTITVPNLIASNSVDSYFDAKELSEIALSDSVIRISSYTFQECSNVKSIHLPSSVQEIKECTFDDCCNLESITIDDGNTYFKTIDGILYNFDLSGVLYVPQNITSIKILPSVTSICKGAFRRHELLQNVVLPDSITSIEEYAFKDCASLNEIVIPSGVISIERNAFEGCSSLKSVTIPDSLTKIGEDAFRGCGALSRVLISDITSWCSINFRTSWYDDKISNPLYYAHNLYLNGDLVRELVVPDGIKEIKDSAFINCKSLERISLPSSVTKIGKRAFWGCSNLVVDVPDTVKYVGEDSFKGCKSYILDKTIDVEWKDVKFKSGYIRVPGPFGSSVDVKDDNILESMNSMRRYLKKMIPHLTVHFGNDGVTTIINLDEIHDCFIALKIKNDLAALIREGQSTTEILGKIDELSKKYPRIFIPRDKTPYINFLLEKHVADKYPLVPIIEYIGNSREEGALYTIMIDDQPNIVWENNNESRASYVFRCTEENYAETRQQVFDFIMAVAPRKRRYLNSDKCTNIFKEKPRMLVHNTLASWAQRLMCDPDVAVETAETTTTQANNQEQDISELIDNSVYKTVVSIEDIEGELGDVTYEEYDVSATAMVKADYYKNFDGKSQLLLSCTFFAYETLSGDLDVEMSEWGIEDFIDEGFVDDIISDLDINDFSGLSNLDFFALGVPTSGDDLSAEEIGNLLSEALNDAGIDWSCGKYMCTEFFSEDKPSGYLED